MKYFKRYWNEIRGDTFDLWGSSWWFFETDSRGIVWRQVEQYDNGQINRYDEQHLHDKYGGLAAKPLDLDEFKQCEINKEEFEHMWQKAVNW